MTKIELIIELDRLRAWVAEEQAECTRDSYQYFESREHWLSKRQAFNSTRMKVEALLRRVMKDEK